MRALGLGVGWGRCCAPPPIYNEIGLHYLHLINADYLGMLDVDWLGLLD